MKITIQAAKYNTINVPHFTLSLENSSNIHRNTDLSCPRDQEIYILFEYSDPNINVSIFWKKSTSQHEVKLERLMNKGWLEIQISHFPVTILKTTSKNFRAVRADPASRKAFQICCWEFVWKTNFFVICLFFL